MSSSSSKTREPAVHGNPRYKRATAPEPPTPPHFKRSTSTSDDDETAEIAQARAAKRAKRTARFETYHSDPLAGLSDTTIMDAEYGQELAPHLPKPKPRSTCSPSATRFPTRLNKEDTSFVKKALDQIQRLRDTLAVEKASHEQRELKIKQDMMLDILGANRKTQKIETELDRQRRHNIRLEELFQEKVRRLETDLQIQTLKQQKAAAEANAYRADAEHLQVLTTTLEEDLDELRRIENEDAAKRRNDSQGLPPAYGTLDDEDRLPPYNQHYDSGRLEVASFKREIRGNFMARVAAAQARAFLLSTGSVMDKAKAGPELFWQLSRALANACIDLDKILDHSREVAVDQWKFLHHSDGRRSTVINTGTARRSYIADRIAKLVLDLSWRVLSALDVRPIAMTLGPKTKAELALRYNNVDEKLLAALRIAFEDRRTLSEFQHYLTQINALRAQFHLLRAGVGYPYFNKAWLWLGEQVEVERQLTAGMVEEWTVPSGSEVSSVPPRATSDDGV